MSKIARVKFIRDKEPNIKALTAENKVLDGALYVATDTGTLWMGVSSSSLIQIKDNINTNTTYNLTKSGSTITLRGSDGSTFNVTDSNTVYGNATASAAGLMSAADKAKLDGVAAGSNYVTVDAELSTTSTNPVQNKVIKSALDGKSNTGHTHDDRYYTESEINTKLNAKANSSHTHTKAQITDFPTSMPASDVYAWAKQPSKPSYTASEVGAAPASHSHYYLPLSGGTMSGRILRDSGGSWISARNNTIVFGTTANHDAYNPVVGQKTAKGAWTIGNLEGDERLIFSYDTDTNFNAGKNATNKTFLPTGSGGQEIITSTTIGSQSVSYANTAGSVAWSNVSGRPTIPSVGNGTVTITQNGTNKGSFTLNQSGNATIALTDTNTNTWRPEEVIVSSSQPNASTCKLWIKV